MVNLTLMFGVGFPAATRISTIWWRYRGMRDALSRLDKIVFVAVLRDDHLPGAATGDVFRRRELPAVPGQRSHG